MTSYKCIFFDLDHTLWDYETNSCTTLKELYESYGLSDKGVPTLESFHRHFKIVNKQLWDLYDSGRISHEIIRTERFKQILERFGISDEKLCEDLSIEYLYGCPKKGNLVPHAIETLEYLSQHYSMSIVTNGFEEIQNMKLTSGNLHGFFEHIVTSQKAGCKKPASGIFEYAMDAHGVTPEEVIMIGDNLITDIGGATNAAIDTVFFNTEKIVHHVPVKYEIQCLSELQNIL